MMIELLLARDLRYFSKAQIIVVRLIKREYDIHKILPQLYHISDACLRSESYHGLGWVHSYVADPLVTIHEMPE
jgi:hypothetical protein